MNHEKTQVTAGLARRALALVALPLVAALLMGAGGKDDFWAELARPGHKQFLAELKRGERMLHRARRVANRPLARRMISDAVAAFQRAIKASPQNARGYFYLGRALDELGKSNEAIAAYLRSRRIDPLSRQAGRIAFNLGVIYSKVGKFERAIYEYNRAYRIALKGGSSLLRRTSMRSTILGNAAESLMALGRLDEAIQRYREATKLHHGNTLVWYGLAVALDRDEQSSKALAAMQRALTRDRYMRRLRSPGVFFVPAGDIHYYFGLGHLAQGKLAEAKRSFTTFINMLPKSPWAHRARQHLAQLGAGKVPKRRRRRLAPSPQGRTRRSPAQARRTIRYRVQSAARTMRNCYYKEYRKNRRLRGRMVVRFSVTPAGRPRGVRMVSSTLDKRKMQACVLRVLRKIKFGKLNTRRAVTVQYPLDFAPY